MKKKIVINFALLMCFIIAPITSSAEEITKTLEGAKIIEGRTLLPLRSIFETLGVTVEWNGKTNTVYAEKGNSKIVLTINSKMAKVNNVTKSLDVPAKLIDNKTMVPVRFVSEALGAEVSWDKENRFAIIKYQGQQIKVIAQNDISYLMNTNKIYTYKHYEIDSFGNIIDVSYSTIKHVKNEGNVHMWSNGEVWREDSNGLWVDLYGDGSEWQKYLSYPIKVGSKWKTPGDWYDNSIDSVNKTIKTEAGTFKNCVVVDYNYQILTFAEGIGLIKIESRGGFFTELASVKNK